MPDIINVRPLIFILVLSSCLLLQWKIPSRKVTKDRWKFTFSNLAIVLFNNIVISLLPLIPYQTAVFASDNNYGLINFLLNNYPNLKEIPLVITLFTIISIIILDITIYFQHRLFHKNKFLWKLHSMHHIDPMLDVTSGLRFHPLEILISNFIKVFIVLIFGIPPIAVLIFEIALNSLAMFNHSNININPKIEIVLNKILITPALHTIHHSKIFTETNSNYGFSVPWWDKLFHTFKANGKYQQKDIHIGTLPMPDEKYQLFPKMLIQPFINVKNKL